MWTKETEKEYEKHYTIINGAYPIGNGQYEAKAICCDDEPNADGIMPAYELIWNIMDEEAENEEDCCNWDAPDEIREIGGYIADEGRFV